MKFNFPKQEEAVLVHIKLKPTLFEAIKDIAEKEECLQPDAITVLLEGAIGEYYKQAEPTKKVAAYPLPADEEDSPNEDRHIPCPNPKCHRKTKTFAVGTGEMRQGKEFCSVRYADKITAEKAEPHLF